MEATSLSALSSTSDGVCGKDFAPIISEENSDSVNEADYGYTDDQISLEAISPHIIHKNELKPSPDTYNLMPKEEIFKHEDAA